jgi:hypothetical protein
VEKRLPRQKIEPHLNGEADVTQTKNEEVDGEEKHEEKKKKKMMRK